MRIIFLEDVPGSGRAGEVKEVKSGYARNFLLPRNLAAPATHDQLQRIESLRKTAEVKRIKEEQDLALLVEHLSQFTVALSAKISPAGRFYGAVSALHIAEELSRMADREIDRNSVHLAEPIREPGDYSVNLRFAHGVSTTIQVTVTAEGVDEEPDELPEPDQTEDSLEQANAETISDLTEDPAPSTTATEDPVEDVIEEAKETIEQDPADVQDPEKES
jgi:large subunit ribosomal protein L9